ncbi:inorganic pyrophosphatase [Nannochloropsis oceanica]
MKRVASINTINRLTKVQEGEHDTVDYRVHSLDHNEERISLWHELPLFAVDDDARPTGALNFICEIPKFTRRKFEICTTEAGNPIKQDEKNGKPRVFSKGDIFFNYGCFPRTWEDPKHVPEDVGVGGDNDPLDVCEIGLRQIPTGAVRQVKVLGVLCLIDDGEADWKVIAIDEEDRWAGELNDVQDVERLLPGTLHAIREWFRTYKIPDGKPENRFALGERFMGVKYTMRVIRETHEAWKRLIKSSGGMGGVGEGSNGSLARNLSVPSLEKLNMDSDQQAVFALMGPDGTPRVPGAVGPLTCLVGEEEGGGEMRGEGRVRGGQERMQRRWWGA